MANQMPGRNLMFVDGTNTLCKRSEVVSVEFQSQSLVSEVGTWGHPDPPARSAVFFRMTPGDSGELVEQHRAGNDSAFSAPKSVSVAHEPWMSNARGLCPSVGFSASLNTA